MKLRKIAVLLVFVMLFASCEAAFAWSWGRAAQLGGAAAAKAGKEAVKNGFSLTGAWKSLATVLVVPVIVATWDATAEAMEAEPGNKTATFCTTWWQRFKDKL